MKYYSNRLKEQNQDFVKGPNMASLNEVIDIPVAQTCLCPM